MGVFANLGSWERMQVRLFISISFIFGKKQMEGRNFRLNVGFRQVGFLVA